MTLWTRGRILAWGRSALGRAEMRAASPGAAKDRSFRLVELGVMTIRSSHRDSGRECDQESGASAHFIALPRRRTASPSADRPRAPERPSRPISLALTDS